MFQKINVVQVIPTFMIGGIEKMVADISKVMDGGRRFHVQLYCTCAPKEGGTLYEYFKDELPPLTCGPVTRTLSLRGLGKLRAFIIRHGIRIVHSHAFEAYSLARPAARMVRGTKSVTTLHNSHPWHFDADFKSLLKRTISTLTAWTASDLLIADSIRIRDHYVRHLRYPGNRIRVLYNPVDTVFFKRSAADRDRVRHRLGIALSTFLLLNVAKLSVQKNQAFLIEAMCDPRLSSRDAKLLIAGDGPLQADLEEHIDRKGLHNRVLLLGPRKDIRDLMAAADVFVLSSLWEGVPIAMLEAMSMELPVVTPSVGGIGEIIEEGQNGLFFDVHDSGSFVSALSTLLKEAPLRTRMKTCARETVVKKCSLTSYVNRLEELYREVL